MAKFSRKQEIIRQKGPEVQVGKSRSTGITRFNQFLLGMDAYGNRIKNPFGKFASGVAGVMFSPYAMTLGAANVKASQRGQAGGAASITEANKGIGRVGLNTAEAALTVATLGGAQGVIGGLKGASALAKTGSGLGKVKLAAEGYKAGKATMLANKAMHQTLKAGAKAGVVEGVKATSKLGETLTKNKDLIEAGLDLTGLNKTESKLITDFATGLQGIEKGQLGAYTKEFLSTNKKKLSKAAINRLEQIKGSMDPEYNPIKLQSDSTTEPEIDYTYRTKLTDKEEKEFQDWYGKVSKHKNLNPNPDSEDQLYDYRGFWKNENRDEILTDNPEAHFTDTYKMPGHPTFSTGSIYSSDETLGGTWEEKDGQWYFTHSPYTAKYADKTRKYLEGSGENMILDGEVFNFPKLAKGGKIPNSAPSHEEGGVMAVDKQGNAIAEVEGGERVLSVADDNKMLALIKKGNMSKLGAFVKSVVQKHNANPSPTYAEGGTGDLGIDIQKFKDGIARSESGGNYNIINQSGSSATGKYQFLWNTWGSSIMQQTGVKSKQEFLNNPKAQEDFMDYVINNIYSQSVRNLKSLNEAKGYTDEQLMALIHFQGEGGAKTYLKTGEVANAANNATVQQYFTKAGFGNVPTPSSDKVNQSLIEKYDQALADNRISQNEYDKIVNYIKTGKRYMIPEFNDYYNLSYQYTNPNSKSYKEWEKENKIDKIEEFKSLVNRQKELIKKAANEKGKKVSELGSKDYTSLQTEILKLGKEIGLNEDALLFALPSTFEKNYSNMFRIAEAKKSQAEANRINEFEYKFQKVTDELLTSLENDPNYKNLTSEEKLDLKTQIQEYKANLKDLKSKAYQRSWQFNKNTKGVILYNEKTGKYESAKLLEGLEFEKKNLPEINYLHFGSGLDASLFGIDNQTANDIKSLQQIETDRIKVEDAAEYDRIQRERQAQADVLAEQKEAEKAAEEAKEKEAEEKKKLADAELESQVDLSILNDSQIQDLLTIKNQERESTGISSLADKFGGIDTVLQMTGMLAAYKSATEPLPEQRKSQEWQNYMDIVKERSQMGMSPESMTLFQRNAERTYATDVNNIGRMATSAQSALGALSQASRRKYVADMTMGAQDAALREEHFGQYASSLAVDEKMTQDMWERNVFNEANRKRELKAGLIGQATKNIRDQIMFNKQYGEGSMYDQLMKETIREKELANRSMLISQITEQKKGGATDEQVKSSLGITK